MPACRMLRRKGGSDSLWLLPCLTTVGCMQRALSVREALIVASSALSVDDWLACVCIPLFLGFLSTTVRNGLSALFIRLRLRACDQ